MEKRINRLIRKGASNRTDDGLLSDSGATVPTDATAGYRTGCIFSHTDGGAGTAFYINEGSVTSCAFAAVAGLTAAQEALLSATAGVATASKALVLDASGDIASGTIVLADMTPGTGISAGTGTISAGSVVKSGGLIKTTIFVDLAGLNSGGTSGDIIGKTSAANCHIGQITAAKNGTVKYGQITCLETPATGDDDIDFYGTVTEATGTQDTAISALTGEAQLLDNGNWTAAVATPIALTTLPGVGYLYMVNLTTAATATYSTGQFLIELWGV